MLESHIRTPLMIPKFEKSMKEYKDPPASHKVDKDNALC